MKRVFLYLYIFVISFAFAGQAYAVQMRASAQAITNTKNNEIYKWNCARYTKDIEKMEKCKTDGQAINEKALDYAKKKLAYEKAQAEAKAAAKKKAEMMQMLGAGMSAAGSMMNMGGGGGNKAEPASDSAASSRSTSGGNTSTGSPKTNDEVSPASNNNTNTAQTNTVQKPLPTPTRRPSNTAGQTASKTTAEKSAETSPHKCKNNITTKNIGGSCKDENTRIKIDVSAKCMCVGIHCFDIELHGIDSLIEASEGKGALSKSTSSGRLSTKIAERSVSFISSAKAIDNETGIHIVDEKAFEYLEKTIVDSKENKSLTQMKVCRRDSLAGEGGGRRPVARKATQTTATPSVAPLQAANDNNAQKTSSQLTQRMNYAVKIRNQFAQEIEDDSVN